MVTIPVRNAGPWIQKCLDSVASQQYEGDWTCAVIDDASTDDTWDKIESYISSLDPRVASKFLKKKNLSRVGILRNFIEGYKMQSSEKEPDAVLINLDGDDWLYSPVVFQIIDYVYKVTSCWVTWGSYIDWPSGEIGKFSKQIDPAIHLSGNYRKSQWSTSHLRTYKSHLWSRIKDEDFKDNNGEYFKASCDLAIMFPIIEMARERSYFIPNILLCYNRTNPAAEHLSSRNEQLSNEELIRSRKPYERIEI